MVVPFAGADVFEKPGNLLFRFEDLSIEVTRIPVDQHAAEVKYDSINVFIHDIGFEEKNQMSAAVIRLTTSSGLMNVRQAKSPRWHFSVP